MFQNNTIYQPSWTLHAGKIIINFAMDLKNAGYKYKHAPPPPPPQKKKKKNPASRHLNCDRLSFEIGYFNSLVISQAHSNPLFHLIQFFSLNTITIAHFRVTFCIYVKTNLSAPESIRMKMTSTCTSIFIQYKLIFI